MPRENMPPPPVEPNFGRELLPGEQEYQDGREEYNENIRPYNEQIKNLRDSEDPLDQEELANLMRAREDLREERRELQRRVIEAKMEYYDDIEDYPSEEQKKAAKEGGYEMDSKGTVIKKYRSKLKDYQLARRMARKATGTENQHYWQGEALKAKKRLDTYLDTPSEFPQLEKMYFEWTRARVKHGQFTVKERQLSEVKKELEKPRFVAGAEISQREAARLEAMSREETSLDDIEEEDVEALKFLYSKKELEEMGGEEAVTKAFKDQLAANREQATDGFVPLEKMSKAQLEEMRERLNTELDETWEDDLDVQKVEEQWQLDRLINAVSGGDKVLETPSVIRRINKLVEWEKLHRNTTIGGVLIGEPGTGKSTIVHHYYEHKYRGTELEGKRNLVYLDLSEEVTRYMLFGTRSIEFKDPVEYFRSLADTFSEMDDKMFTEFLEANSDEVAETFKASKEEGKAILIQMMREELRNANSRDDIIRDCKGMSEGDLKKYSEENLERLAGIYGVGFKKEKGEDGNEVAIISEEQKEEILGKLKEDVARGIVLSPEGKAKLEQAREMLTDKTNQGYYKELTKKFKHIVSKNGWRDGVVISALRRGDSILFDEFNRSKDLTLLFGLATAKPGEMWYFEDNDEHIRIPEDWRMYFTANIGRRHGAYKVAEAFASRAKGKVMEVEHAPSQEEMTIALALLCDANGYVLTDNEDTGKMVVFMRDALSKLRNLSDETEGVSSISWRDIRDITEKLVYQEDMGGVEVGLKNGDMNFDQALYEVLIDGNKTTADQKSIKKIVEVCSSVGLLLRDDLKDRLIKEEFITEAEWQKLMEIQEDNPGFSEELEEMLSGGAMKAGFATEGRPERTQ